VFKMLDRVLIARINAIGGDLVAKRSAPGRLS
jgi:hypothetical protein